MSAGHHAHRGGMSAGDVDRILADPGVKANLARPKKVDRTHDLPFLAGYSKDGRTIYIDRHLPKDLKIGGRKVDPDEFLELHEDIEKSLIDALDYKYPAAHEIATEAEHRAVRKAGLDPKAYEAALKPYIKADETEKLKRVPPDLDLRPYETPPVNEKLLMHIWEAQHHG